MESDDDTVFLYNGRDGVITEPNGLYYMRARYYYPEFQRFISPDTRRGSIENAVTLNRFAYANCNPVMNVDPTGHSAERGKYDDFLIELLGDLKSLFTTSEDDDSDVDVISSAAPMVVGREYDLGKGWKARIERSNQNSNKCHIHISKNGEEYSQNEDGSPYDGSVGSPPKKVLKEVKNKLGWDWNEKQNDYIKKLEDQGMVDPRLDSLYLNVDSVYLTFPSTNFVVPSMETVSVSTPILLNP